MITIIGILQVITFLAVCLFVIGMIVPRVYFPSSHLPRYEVFKYFGSVAVVVLTLTLVWSSVSHNYFSHLHEGAAGIVVLDMR